MLQVLKIVGLGLGQISIYLLAMPVIYLIIIPITMDFMVVTWFSERGQLLRVRRAADPFGSSTR